MPQHTSSFAHALPREGPSGCVDLASFRAGMRALAGAVTVLTTVHDGRRWGLTATAVCSVSADPPRLHRLHQPARRELCRLRGEPGAAR
jgi:flavin reductase (DIM6/NTAB) family NADH-FMN oxidoreductase RutF